MLYIGHNLVQSGGDKYLDLDLSDEDRFNTDNPDSKDASQEENQTYVKEKERIPNQSDILCWTRPLRHP